MSNSTSTSKPPVSLYFIAVIPDPYFQSEVVKIKNHMKEKYGSGHALKSPAHITLHMPFKWRDDRIERLSEVLKKLAVGRERFTVRLKNFNAFPPRVIYIDVEKNDTLEHLHKAVSKAAAQKLKLHNSQYKQKGFHPHMTVAFRDLKPSMFHEAWDEFKERPLEHEFEVGSFFLLKHNGRSWDIFSEFKFQSP